MPSRVVCGCCLAWCNLWRVLVCGVACTMRGNDAHPTCFRLLLSLILPLVRPLLLPLLFLSFLLRYHKLALWATLVFFSYGSQLQLGVALLISTMKVRTVVWSIVNMILRTHCCCVVWYYIVSFSYPSSLLPFVASFLHSSIHFPVHPIPI